MPAAGAGAILQPVRGLWTACVRPGVCRMPIYEYSCARCGKVTALLERRGAWNLWRRRCASCGSRRLRRVYSTFSTAKKQSMGDLLNEMRRMGPVNFVPAPPSGLQGPPPGGCPYAAGGSGETKTPGGAA